MNWRKLTKIFHQSELQTSPIKSFHEDGIARVNTELKSIPTPIEPQMVSFECDSFKMLAELHNLGKLVKKVRSEVDYKSKRQSLVSICENGKGMEHLNCPHDVTVDNKTGNIYITGTDSNCVKVLIALVSRIFRPLGVAICGDRILISQGNDCILNYQLNGNFISKIGKYGNEGFEFSRPAGLTIDESNGNISVSDNQNNRIQILSQDFRFISQFGKDTLKYPRDVKLSKEYIFVLDQSNPCLHLFNYNHIIQKSVISRGKGMEVIIPYYFFIDQTDNILISDYASNSILIFNRDANLWKPKSGRFFPFWREFQKKSGRSKMKKRGLKIYAIFKNLS